MPLLLLKTASKTVISCVLITIELFSYSIFVISFSLGCHEHSLHSFVMLGALEYNIYTYEHSLFACAKSRVSKIPICFDNRFIVYVK